MHNSAFKHFLNKWGLDRGCGAAWPRMSPSKATGRWQMGSFAKNWFSGEKSVWSVQRGRSACTPITPLPSATPPRPPHHLHTHHFLGHSSYCSSVSSHERSFSSGKPLRFPPSTLQIGLARPQFPRFHRAHPSLPLDLVLDPQFPRQPPTCLPFLSPTFTASNFSSLCCLGAI